MTPKRRNNSTDKATSTSNASKLSKPPNRKVSSRLPHGDIKPANVPKRKLNRTKDADERNGDVKPASVPKRKFNSKKGDEELLPSQQKRVKYSQDLCALCTESGEGNESVGRQDEKAQF